MFREAGYEAVEDDPAVLSVRGRLLKDRALAAAGEERRQFYLAAAEAYARAAEIGGTTYPLINAATLSLLAGRREDSRTLAEKVLARTAADEDEPETPYYRAATRAEAWLLLGDAARAELALCEAITLAPFAYEDHASTLRQFTLILEDTGGDKAWLDALRPPRCLHFAGHIALAAGDDVLARNIRAVIKAECVGFGFGALAAGADILVAEALLEENAELHLVLPALPGPFREHSVARFGKGWAARFDAILAGAASIRALDCDPLSSLSLQLAAEIAMGKAAMQAELLMTEALQLLIVDRSDPGVRPAGGSAWMEESWKRSGRRQRILVERRTGASQAAAAVDAAHLLAAILKIDLSSADPTSLARAILPRLAAILAADPSPVMAARWTGEAVIVAYRSTAEAARAALAASAALAETTFRIAGHCAIATRVDDPFGGPPFLLGAPLALLDRISRSAPSGAIHVSEDFAASLYAGAARARPRTEYVGELPGDDEALRLFAIKAA